MSQPTSTKEATSPAPLKIPERISPARLPANEQVSAAPATSPTVGVWTMVGVIVLIALAAGGLGGFIAGRQYEQATRYDVYWLLGGTFTDVLDGVALDSVYPGGPADGAGLADGDRIVAIDGTPVRSAAQARRLVGQHVPGDTVRFTVGRGFSSEQVDVLLGFLIVVNPGTVEPLPPAPPPPPMIGTSQDTRVGVYYRMLKPGDPFTVANGALIITAWPGGPADSMGLQAGDIITAVNDERITQTLTLEQALSRYAPGETVRLSVLTSDGEAITVRVTLGG